MPATTSYLVMARDPAMSAQAVRHALDRVLAAMPDTRFQELHSGTGVAVLEIPNEKAPNVRKLLGEEFVVEPNSSLGY
jgi:hypothetical protein